MSIQTLWKRAIGIVIVALSLCISADGAADKFFADQQKEFKKREKQLDGYKRKLRQRREAALKPVEGLFKWAKENSALGNLEDLYNTLRSVYPDFPFIIALEPEYDASPARNDAPDIVKTLASKRTDALNSYATIMYVLPKECIQIKLYYNAFEVFREILIVNPEADAVHRLFRNVKAKHPETGERVWASPFEAAQYQDGYIYIKDYGWAPLKDAARYRAGECEVNGTWMSIADADKKHGEITFPWVIEGENFVVRSTMPRADALKVSEALEAFHVFVYGNYMNFFVKDRNPKDVMFRGAFDRKLVSNFFATREQLVAFVRSALRSPDFEMKDETLGFYVPMTNETYFYWREDAIGTAFHELTHQILGCFARKSNAPVWAIEGLAVNMERIRYSNGRIIPMSWPDGCADRLSSMRQKRPTADYVATMTNNRFKGRAENAPPNDEGNVSLSIYHYGVVGGFANFILTANDGIYRSAFMEFCYDGYTREKDAPLRPLNEYLGMTPDELNKVWDAFYVENYRGEITPFDSPAGPEKAKVDAALQAYKDGDARAAIAALDEAERSAQNKANVLAIRGRLKFECWDIFAALDDFDAAIALDEKTPNALYFRGIARMSVWNYGAAADDFARAIAQGSVQPDVRLLRARSLAYSGKLNDALADIEAYVAASPASFDGLVEAAMIYRALDKKDAYETALKNAIKAKGPLDEAIEIEQRIEYRATIYRRIASGDFEIPVRMRAVPK